MEVKSKPFVQGCLVCLLSPSGDKSFQFLGSLDHASMGDELLHFGYLYAK